MSYDKTNDGGDAVKLSPEDEIKDLSAELVRVRDLYQRLLMNQDRDRRAMEVTARATAWNDVFRNVDLTVRERVADPYRKLCGRIEYLPLKGRAENGATIAELLPSLKDHARQVAVDLARITEQEMCQQNDLLVEVQRLREFVRAHGRTLHAEDRSAQPSGSGRYCACRGCELIREMDAKDGVS